MASYEKHANGTWSVRFRASEDFEVKQKRFRGFKTKKDAELAYLEYKAQIDEEKQLKIAPNSIKLTFNQLYIEYCNYQKNRIKESSYIDMTSKMNTHILPFFKKYTVVNISPKLILNWQNTLNKYSYKYKVTLRGYLYSILKYAEKYYKIQNQVNFVDNFRNLEPPKEMQIWEEEDFKKFINSIDKIYYKAFFSALYLTGARKGEILASTWEDWDLKNNTFNINKSVTRKVIGKRYAVTTPKNNSSIRKISIPDSLCNLMKEYKQSLNNFKNTDFVFSDKNDGSQPIASSSIDNFYKVQCNKACVKKIRLHDFRHSHTSYLIAHGVSIVAVAKRLGHKNIEQTLNTYSHLLKDEDIGLINKLNNIKL